MNVQVKPKEPLTLSVQCKGTVVQNYRFMMIKPNGEQVEVSGSNVQDTTMDSHAHEFAPPIPAGTAIHGILTYTTTNGAQPFIGEVKLLQNGKVVPNSVDKDSRSTSADGVAWHRVDYDVI
ncbi:MAG: hypothetical protein WC700_09895 [Gemmatimonadaceae bacterium]